MSTVTKNGSAPVQMAEGTQPRQRELGEQWRLEFKWAIYANYLDAEELRHMREQSGKNGKEWLTLIATVY